jgi:predicted RNase H-like HicB family nuclease
MDRIRVIHHYEDGRWWAESPDVPEWFAAAETYAEAHQLAQEGIPFALERNNVAIEHFVPADIPAAA